MKSTNAALLIAGIIFGLVAILHLLRILTGVPVNIAGWELPVWINWMGLFGGGFLCLWTLLLSVTKK